MMTTRQTRIAAALSAAAAALAAGAAPLSPAGAQSLLDRTVRTGPQYIRYDIGKGGAKRSISELAFPIAVVVPIGSRLNFDLATAYARAELSGAAPKSTINGLTDTQLRANYTLGDDRMVLTLGLNVPTGQATLEEDEELSAGLIGNDFFAFPISNMGTGFGGTGGVAYAQPVGAWNLGVGASVRRMGAYDYNARTRFQPGDEYRVRVGVDRPLLTGRAALGLTYFAFGDDEAGTFTYSTGDRLVGQGAYSFPWRQADVFISAWNLLRFQAEQEVATSTQGAMTPWENITNFGASVSFRTFANATLEPNVELRHWVRDNEVTFDGGQRAGTMALLGVRTRADLRGVTLYPSVAYALGSISNTDPTTGVNTTSDRLGGWRLVLTARVAR
jgi:hypothetical protein